MPILSVVALKGGVGKSTLVTALAVELSQRQHKVLIADTDPQGTVLCWRAILGSAEVMPWPNPSHRDGFAKRAKEYDWTLIDTPPHAGPIMRAALVVADIALLPTIPGAADAWALGETIAVFLEAQKLRPELNGAVLLNRVSRRTALGAGARAALTDCGMPILKSELGLRVAYAEAMAAGKGPTTYASSSPAAGETRELVDELERLAKKWGRRAH